jgi:hypothetical protein
MRKITEDEYKKLSIEFDLTLAAIKTVVVVESGQKGFDEATGKLIIQFEPAWFKRNAPYTPSGKWSLNKVEKQAREWECFNDAYARNPIAAMESTSVGMMQVMGFHWKLLGFHSVGQMWDYAKFSEYNQLRLGLLFIRSNKYMYRALKSHDWNTFAYYYNGEKYREFNYQIKLQAAFNNLSKSI